VLSAVAIREAGEDHRLLCYPTPVGRHSASMTTSSGNHVPGKTSDHRQKEAYVRLRPHPRPARATASERPNARWGQGSMSGVLTVPGASRTNPYAARARCSTDQTCRRSVADASTRRWFWALSVTGGRLFRDPPSSDRADERVLVLWSGEPGPGSVRRLSTSLRTGRASMDGHGRRLTRPSPRHWTPAGGQGPDGPSTGSGPESGRACRGPQRGIGMSRRRSAGCSRLSRHIGRHRPARRASPTIRNSQMGRRSVNACAEGHPCMGGHSWVSDFPPQNCPCRSMMSAPTTHTASAAQGLRPSVRWSAPHRSEPAPTFRQWRWPACRLTLRELATAQSCPSNCTLWRDQPLRGAARASPAWMTPSPRDRIHRRSCALPVLRPVLRPSASMWSEWRSSDGRAQSRTSPILWIVTLSFTDPLEVWSGPW